MDVRLVWDSPASGASGAFTLRGRPLHVVALPDGRLDRLTGEAASRPGFRVEAAADCLRLEARAGGAFVAEGRVESRAELRDGMLIFRAAEGAELRLRADGLAPPAPPDPLVGRTLGAYRILERLGMGGVGVVYKALQAGLEREVALKVLNPKAATPLTVASFKREAVAAGRLSHPNLVQVYEIGHDQGLHFFSMELVPGGNLETHLEERGPLPWQEALGYARDCAEALAFAQDHHLVHRDVKPENLMLTKDGRAKLADLGMAATRGMLEQESAGGSPHFMAPECVGGVPDHRADLYSLGCTLHRLLTGETPFQGASVKEILRAHRDQAVPELRDRAPQVPAEIAAFVARLMAKDPAERPESARAAAEEIGAMLQPRRSRLPVLLLGLLAIVGGGTGIYFATRPSDQVAEPERVIEYRERDETPEERAARAARDLERAFLLAMAAPEGGERSTALDAFLAAHPGSEYEGRARAELDRLAALAAQPVTDEDDALARIRAELARLGEGVEQRLALQRYGEAYALLEASGVPAQLREDLGLRLAQAADAAMARWEGDHARAIGAQNWAAAAQARQDFASALDPGASGAPPPQAWRERLQALEQAGGSAETAARTERFAAERAAALAALQGPVSAALLRCDPAAALDALDAAIAVCGHSGLRAALAAERPVFAAALPAAQALFARLDGSSEVAILEPLDGKRALAVEATPGGIRLFVTVRGDRVERVDPWAAFARADAFQSLLRAVVPAAVDDAAVTALHLLVGAAAASERMRGEPPPEPGLAAARSAETLAWLEPLPRQLQQEPDWLPRHAAALRGLAGLYAAQAEQDAYLAWQRAQVLAADFSLLGALCSDGSSTWQFQP